MANQVIKIKDHSPKTSESYFFDNNIWMFLLCPSGNYEIRKQSIYSSFLNNLRGLKIPVFINSMVLSEFANSYLRRDFKLTNDNPATAGQFANFKRDFVGSNSYNIAVKEVKKHIENIMKLTEKCSDEYPAINMANILVDFVAVGFNDSYYANLANKRGMIVVSDDSDFTKNKISDRNLKVVTA